MLHSMVFCDGVEIWKGDLPLLTQGMHLFYNGNTYEVVAKPLVTLKRSRSAFQTLTTKQI